MDLMDMMESAEEFKTLVSEHPEKVQGFVALCALSGAVAAEGHNGAKAAVDLAYDVAAVFLARTFPPTKK